MAKRKQQEPQDQLPETSVTQLAVQKLRLMFKNAGDIAWNNRMRARTERLNEQAAAALEAPEETAETIKSLQDHARDAASNALIQRTIEVATQHAPKIVQLNNEDKPGYVIGLLNELADRAFSGWQRNDKGADVFPTYIKRFEDPEEAEFVCGIVGLAGVSQDPAPKAAIGMRTYTDQTDVHTWSGDDGGHYVEIPDSVMKVIAMYETSPKKNERSE